MMCHDVPYCVEKVIAGTRWQNRLPSILLRVLNRTPVGAAPIAAVEESLEEQESRVAEARANHAEHSQRQDYCANWWIICLDWIFGV